MSTNAHTHTIGSCCYPDPMDPCDPYERRKAMQHCHLWMKPRIFVGKWESERRVKVTLLGFGCDVFFGGAVLFLHPQMTKYRKSQLENMILSNQMLSIFAAHLSLRVRTNPISKIADLYHTWIHDLRGVLRLGRTGSLRRFKAGRASKVNSLNLGSLAVHFFVKSIEISQIFQNVKLKHFPAGHHFIFLCKKPTELILGSLHFEIFCGIYYGDVNPKQGIKGAIWSIPLKQRKFKFQTVDSSLLQDVNVNRFKKRQCNNCSRTWSRLDGHNLIYPMTA